jgi:flagellin
MMRANIGGTINRLEHNVNNLMNQVQNTQSAESQIRDLDFSAESVTMSKNMILSQSATSMLAQANISAKAILKVSNF